MVLFSKYVYAYKEFDTGFKLRFCTCIQNLQEDRNRLTTENMQCLHTSQVFCRL